jgi:hypothetical protein
MKMFENKEVTESLTFLKTQVDRDDQVHSFADANKTWKFMNPLTLVNLVERYNNLLEETGEGLKSLKTQVDRDGQFHSFANVNKTWKFISPPALVNLVEPASWYVIAFVFNIFGGILGYFAVKDEDHNTANHLLIVGFISLIILFILGFSGFISLVW